MNRGLWLWLLAGPNGAGKSTYAPNLSSDVEEIVRPDELASELSPAAPDTVAVKAARLAIGRIRSLLEEREASRWKQLFPAISIWRLQSAPGPRAGRWVLFTSGSAVRNWPSNASGYDVFKAAIMCPQPMFGDATHEAWKIWRASTKLRTGLVVLDNSSSASSSRRKPMTLVLEALQGRIVFRRRCLPGWLRGKLGPILKVRSRN
jgi:hypothetical protein